MAKKRKGEGAQRLTLQGKSKESNCYAKELHGKVLLRQNAQKASENHYIISTSFLHHSENSASRKALFYQGFPAFRFLRKNHCILHHFYIMTGVTGVTKVPEMRPACRNWQRKKPGFSMNSGFLLELIPRFELGTSSLPRKEVFRLEALKNKGFRAF